MHTIRAKNVAPSISAAEINMAIWFELIPLKDVLELIDNRPPEVELILRILIGFLSLIIPRRKWAHPAVAWDSLSFTG